MVKSKLDRKEDLEILNWITPIDYGPEQSDLIGRRYPGTGQWLINSPKFKDWVETDQQTLLCPGIPGAGKTIFTAIIIEHLTRKFHTDASTGIAYIYCNFRRKHEQKLNDLMASLLKQLSEAKFSMPNAVKELYEQHKIKHTRPSTDELSKALQAVAASYTRVFVIVDALDECQISDGCQTRFIGECFALQARCGTNLFMTSRFLPEIMEKFDKASKFEIRASPEDV